MRRILVFPLVSAFLMGCGLVAKESTAGLTQEPSGGIRIRQVLSDAERKEFLPIADSLPEFLKTWGEVGLGWPAGVSIEVVIQPPKEMNKHEALRALYGDTFFDALPHIREKVVSAQSVAELSVSSRQTI